MAHESLKAQCAGESPLETRQPLVMTMTLQSPNPLGRLGVEPQHDEEGWIAVRRPRRASRIIRSEDSTAARLMNHFAVLETIVEEEEEQAPPLPKWVFNQPSVDHFGRIMDEMIWYHRKRWGKAALTPPMDESPEDTESASALKRFLMIEWFSHRKDLKVAGSETWVEKSALWGRIALHRLRFMGGRQWYAVATTADEQRRRILVLAVPPKNATKAEKSAHAARQMTYNDTIEDLYEPGIRVSKGLRELVGPRMRAGLTKRFKIPHKYHPQRHHGKNYGGVKDMPDKAEAQLAKERGRFNEGPLVRAHRPDRDLQEMQNKGGDETSDHQQTRVGARARQARDELGKESSAESHTRVTEKGVGRFGQIR